MNKANWLHDGDRCVVTYVEYGDALDGVDVGMLGTVKESDDPCPYVAIDGIADWVPLYQSQIRRVTEEDLKVVSKPQPVRAVTITESDVMAVLTKYVKDEIGIDAEVSHIRNAFEGALTLVFKEAA